LVSRGCPAKTIGSVLTDTPPGGDPLPSRYPSKSAAAQWPLRAESQGKLTEFTASLRPTVVAFDTITYRDLDYESQLPLPHKAHVIEGYYTRNVEIDGKKYAVLDDFDTKKQHLVPFKEEYRQLKMFRAMQYDGTTLHYAPQKSPIEKTIGDKVRHLPGKEK
jgi:hypothetical protein